MNYLDAINAADFLNFNTYNGGGQVSVWECKVGEWSVLAQNPAVTNKVVWLYELDDQSKAVLERVYGEADDQTN